MVIPLRSKQSARRVVMWRLMSTERLLGLKVFSATKARDRESLGDVVTEWLRTHPDHQAFYAMVSQSSDAEYHCLTITVLYWYQ